MHLDRVVTSGAAVSSLLQCVAGTPTDFDGLIYGTSSFRHNSRLPPFALHSLTLCAALLRTSTDADGGHYARHTRCALLRHAEKAETWDRQHCSADRPAHVVLHL